MQQWLNQAHRSIHDSGILPVPARISDGADGFAGAADGGGGWCGEPEVCFPAVRARVCGRGDEDEDEDEDGVVGVLIGFSLTVVSRCLFLNR